jgi:methylated-DNA-[protein]-cysteine S-methyltransferase
MEQHYCLFDTAIGTCGIAWNDRGMTRLRLPESDPRATEKRMRAASARPVPASAPTQIEAVITELRRYFAGAQVDFSSVVLDLHGAEPFHRHVYQALRSIRWGRTTTYGELAREAGAPGEAREVGQAMAHNPIPIIIPCHRVLAAGNKAGGFSAYGGVFTKERLLLLEGVHVGVAPDAPPLPGILQPQR